MTLYNFGSNPREEFMLLKLFQTALEEVRLNIDINFFLFGFLSPLRLLLPFRNFIVGGTKQSSPIEWYSIWKPFGEQRNFVLIWIFRKQVKYFDHALFRLSKWLFNTIAAKDHSENY